MHFPVMPETTRCTILYIWRKGSYSMFQNLLISRKLITSVYRVITSSLKWKLDVRREVEKIAGRQWPYLTPPKPISYVNSVLPVLLDAFNNKLSSKTPSARLQQRLTPVSFCLECRPDVWPYLTEANFGYLLRLLCRGTRNVWSSSETSYPGRGEGGGYFRNFWVGMCRWGLGTLNL